MKLKVNISHVKLPYGKKPNDIPDKQMAQLERDIIFAIQRRQFFNPSYLEGIPMVFALIYKNMKISEFTSDEVRIKIIENQNNHGFITVSGWVEEAQVIDNKHLKLSKAKTL